MKIKDITLAGVLSAICIISRQFLIFLPNIKPITSILIIVSIYYSLRVGIMVAITTVLVSGVLLGLGTFTPFQILAWLIIITGAYLLKKLIGEDDRVFLIYSILSGYLYGIIVSIEKLLIGGPSLYISYYIGGLYFDTLHSVGNLVFYPICLFCLKPILRKYKENLI